MKPEYIHIILYVNNYINKRSDIPACLFHQDIILRRPSPT